MEGLIRATNTSVVIGAFVWIALGVGIFYVACAENADQQAQQAHKCDMVDIWHESGGEYGWPPSVAPGCGLTD